MGLTVDGVAAAATKKSGGKQGVRVTEKVKARAEEKGAGQACISIHGLDEHRGDVVVSLDDATYRITKTDTHAAWATKQGDNVNDFVNLFNVLAETPNKFRGEVEAAE